MKIDIAIKLSNLSKKYIVHYDKPTLTERLLNGNGDEFWALKNLNLTINKGERVGIIGANGSGKTTLLKIISGISSPTNGSVRVTGRVVSLIDLLAGFNSELTGFQNIYLNGLMLGMNKNQIINNLENIINFADIGKFIDVPVFTYSSGMLLRLGFSVAIHSDPDILVLDENIAVGDQGFRKKTYEKLEEMSEQKKTILTATHNLMFVKNFCSKAILLDHAKIVCFGDTRDVLKVMKSNFSSLVD